MTRKGFKWDVQKQRLELYAGDVAPVAYWDDIPGRTYYVNNATGSDSNDGLSWGSAFDQVNAAIIASEAHRITAYTSSGTAVGARYQTQRNRIVVYGAGLAGEYYNPILYTTNLVDPHHCDIIGIGDLPNACGDGVVQIGSTTTATIAFHTSTNTTVGEPGMFGTKFYNLAFRGGGGATYYAVEFGKVRGDGFYDCAFSHNAVGVGAIKADEMFAGMVFDNCQFRSEGGTTTYMVNVTGGGVAAWTLFNNCYFLGAGSDTVTNHIRWAGGSHSSLVKNCYFTGTVTVAIADTSTYGLGIMNNFFGGGCADCYSYSSANQIAGNYHAEALETI